MRIKTFVLMFLLIKKENDISRTRVKNLILNQNLKLNNKIILIHQKKFLNDILELIFQSQKRLLLNLTNII